MALPVKKPFCPYCGCEIPVPTNQTSLRCPTCGERLFIRLRATDRTYVICTKQTRDVVDDEWRRIHTASEFQPLIDYRARYHFGMQEWLDAFEEGEGVDLSGQVAWRLADQKARALLEAEDWKQLAILYFTQAYQAWAEGADPFDRAWKSRFCTLLGYYASGVSRVRIAAPGGCDKCAPLDGRVLTLREALFTNPIPVRECTTWLEPGEERTGWCRCTYLAELESMKERDTFDDAWTPSPPLDEKEQEKRYQHYYLLTEQEWNTARVMAEDLAAFKGEPVPLLRDIAWEIAGRKIYEAVTTRDWITLSHMYRGKSRQLQDEGRPSFNLQREAERWYLGGLQQADRHSAVRVRVFSHACRFCRPLRNKLFDIEEALRIMPLPVKECTRGWHCCAYEAAPETPAHIFPHEQCGEALTDGPVGRNLPATAKDSGPEAVEGAIHALLEVPVKLPPRTARLLYLSDGPPRAAGPSAEFHFSRDRSGQPSRKAAMSFNDPSIIYTRLPVWRPSGGLVPLGYYPSYAEMTPDQRWHYLHWLQDPTGRVSIGYVFVYYYGLERQLLTGDFDAAFDEVLMLREHHNNYSFDHYSAKALLTATIVRNRPEKFPLLLELGITKALRGSHLALAYDKGYDLAAAALLGASHRIPGAKRYYLREHATRLHEALDACLVEKYGSPSFPFAGRYDDTARLPAAGRLEFANISFPPEYRTLQVPDFFKCEPFLDDVREILVMAHERVKAELAEERRAARVRARRPGAHQQTQEHGQ